MARKDLQFLNITQIANDENSTAKKHMKTAEDIDVKSKYTSADIKDLEHLDYAAGIAPNLRTYEDLGLLDSMLDFLLQKKAMPFTDVIWLLGKKAFQ